jgi:hypothetical protein
LINHLFPTKILGEPNFNQENDSGEGEVSLKPCCEEVEMDEQWSFVLNLRTWIKRLTRKTICFSKSEKMHDIVIGLLINKVEFGIDIHA